VRLTSVCLSRTSGLSRKQRPSKTKIHTEVAHITRDSDTTLKVKRSKVNLQGAGAYCGGFPRSLYIYILNTVCLKFAHNTKLRVHSDQKKKASHTETQSHTSVVGRSVKVSQRHCKWRVRFDRVCDFSCDELCWQICYFCFIWCQLALCGEKLCTRGPKPFGWNGVDNQNTSSYPSSFTMTNLIAVRSNDACMGLKFFIIFVPPRVGELGHP